MHGNIFKPVDYIYFFNKIYFIRSNDKVYIRYNKL